MYCLLGAQVKARQSASSLELQQQFLILVNKLINKKQSLEESIKNFEDASSKTRGKIDYVVSKRLYMIPSDMNLNKLGEKRVGFNDKAIIAGAFDTEGEKPNPPQARPKPTPTPVPVSQKTIPLPAATP